MFRDIGVAALAAFLSVSAAAAPQSDRLPAAELNWREMLPDVVYFAPAYGDWEQGAHGKYARIQPGATVPMHTHSKGYHGILISGRLTNRLDNETTRVMIEPGDYWYMAGNRPHGHVCVSKEPCLFYTHSDGRWDLKLVE